MIKLNSNQCKCLLNLDISDKARAVLEKGNELNDELADGLRDICTDRFDSIGLDENYKETKEGIILNELIDALYAS